MSFQCKKRLLMFVSSAIIVSSSSIALAQEEDTTFDALTTALEGYYKKLIAPIGIVLAAIVIVYAGIVYATSQGQPDKLALAKELIIGAIVGLTILLSAGWIVTQVVGK